MNYEITPEKLRALATHQQAVLTQLMDRFPVRARMLEVVNEISRLQKQVIALRIEAAELEELEKTNDR